MANLLGGQKSAGALRLSNSAFAQMNPFNNPATNMPRPATGHSRASAIVGPASVAEAHRKHALIVASPNPIFITAHREKPHLL